MRLPFLLRKIRVHSYSSDQRETVNKLSGKDLLNVKSIHALQLVALNSFLNIHLFIYELDVVQSLNVHLFVHVHLFVTPWTAECQASLFFAISRSLLKLISTEQVMPSNHVVLCHPFLLLPSIFTSISLFYGPTLKSVYVYWKNHNFDYDFDYRPLLAK